MPEMNRLEQRNQTSQEPDPNPNTKTLSPLQHEDWLLLAYRAIWVRLWERGIGARDIGGTVATC